MRRDVELDAFVIMPNHLHGILLLGRSEAAPAARPLGAVVRGFKAATTSAIGAAGHALSHPLWQRNYYEHIIRNEESLEAIRAYIADNPAKWAYDRQNPAAGPSKPDAAWQV
jgi:REP element-mobilizing transposase RayT